MVCELYLNSKKNICQQFWDFPKKEHFSQEIGSKEGRESVRSPSRSQPHKNVRQIPVCAALRASHSERAQLLGLT